MTYTPPTFRRITITAPTLSLPPLVCGQYDGGSILAEVELRGGIQASEKSVLGETVLEGTAYNPYQFWKIEYRSSSEDDVALLREFNAQLQADPTLQFVLTDEFYFVTQTESTWHNRTAIAGSSRTKNGITVTGCAFNIWLSVIGAHWNPQPPGWADLSFTCEEVI